MNVEFARSIFERDGLECQFVYPHDCGGKLGLHHINGKGDKPENVITVCRRAHWEKVHNGASPSLKAVWEIALLFIAQDNTRSAIAGGWRFPEE